MRCSRLETDLFPICQAHNLSITSDFAFTFFDQNFVLIAFVIVVLGGMGSIEGALLGGICVGVVQSLSSYYVAPAFGQMFFFILFLLVMIFRPNGLLGQKGAATIGMND